MRTRGRDAGPSFRQYSYRQSLSSLSPPTVKNDLGLGVVQKAGILINLENSKHEEIP